MSLLSKAMILVILLLFATVAGVGNILREEDIEANLTLNGSRHTTNMTFTRLNCTDLKYNGTFGEWICETTNYIGYSSIKWAKAGYEFGYNNPDFNGLYIQDLIIFAINLLIISLYASFITPILIVCLLIYWLVKYLIKKYKEKKE